MSTPGPDRQRLSGPNGLISLNFLQTNGLPIFKVQTVLTDIPIPAKLPFLRAICWDLDDIKHLNLDEVLNRYERGWKYRGVLADLEGEELAFLRKLAQTKGSFLQTEV